MERKLQARLNPIKAPTGAGTAHSPSVAKVINPERPGRRAMKTHSPRPLFPARRLLYWTCLIPVSPPKVF